MSANALSSQTPRQITVTDQEGRKVTLNVPVTAVYADYVYTDEVIRAVGAGKDIVATDDSADPKDPTNAADKVYLASFAHVVDAGNAAEPNWEAIVRSGAKLAIMRENGPWQDAIKELSPFGIKVIVITAWEPNVIEQYIPVLGQIFGTESQAAKLENLDTSITTALHKGLAGVTAKPSVYFENGAPNEAALPGSGWDTSITEGGGSNIFSDLHFNSSSEEVQQYSVDPAVIIRRAPAAIITDDVPGAVSGYDIWPTKTFVSAAEKIADRAGWGSIPAVKNKDIFVFNNFFYSALAKQIGALAAAKWLHPHQFANVNVSSYFDEWLELQGIPPQSIDAYSYALNGEKLS